MEIGRQESDFCHLNSDLWIAFAPSAIPVLLAPSAVNSWSASSSKIANSLLPWAAWSK